MRLADLHTMSRVELHPSSDRVRPLGSFAGGVKTGVGAGVVLGFVEMQLIGAERLMGSAPGMAPTAGMGGVPVSAGGVGASGMGGTCVGTGAPCAGGMTGMGMGMGGTDSTGMGMGTGTGPLADRSLTIIAGQAGNLGVGAGMPMGSMGGGVSASTGGLQPGTSGGMGSTTTTTISKQTRIDQLPAFPESR